MGGEGECGGEDNGVGLGGAGVEESSGEVKGASAGDMAAAGS